MNKTQLKNEIGNLSETFSAAFFYAVCVVEGETGEGKKFRHELIFDNKDPEFMQLINDYGARKAAALMTMQDSERLSQSAYPVNGGY